VKQRISPYRVVNRGLKYQDFDRLMAAVTTVTRAVPIREFPRQIRHQGHAIECHVVGTTHDYAAVTGLKVDRGKFLTDADNAEAQNHVVIGSEVAQPCSRKKIRSESRSRSGPTTTQSSV
jgi:putative ABC transport system permease protein